MPRLIQELALACAFLLYLVFMWAPVPLSVAAVAVAVLLVLVLSRPRGQCRVGVWFVAGVALCLSGCVTSGVVRDLTPEAKERLALKFLDRCGGTVNIGAGGASGQMGGAIHGEFTLTGTCPVPVAPLKDLGKPGTGTEPEG